MHAVPRVESFSQQLQGPSVSESNVTNSTGVYVMFCDARVLSAAKSNP